MGNHTNAQMHKNANGQKCPNAQMPTEITRLVKMAKALNGKTHRITHMSKCTKCKLATCTNAQMHTMQTYQNVKITTLEIEKTRYMENFVRKCKSATHAKVQTGKMHKCSNAQNADKSIVKIVSMTKRPTVNMS